jgi:alpha-glucosidase
MVHRLLALTGLLFAFPAAAQVEQSTTALTNPSAPTVASPDGRIVVNLTTDGDGRPLYTISRNGKQIVAPSALGFLFTDAPKLQRNFKVESQAASSVDTRWEQPWGEWKTIHDRHNELRIRLKETTALGRVMEMVFRVFDDGVGFRYELPDQPNLKTAHIADEMTEFSITQDGEAWWIPGSEWNRDEYLYNRTPISSVPLAHTPLTMKLADGTHVAIHEAALIDYSGIWLQRVEGTRFKTVLIPGAGAAKVTRGTPFVTPWRTVILADNAPGLYMSHIELNLNAPNALGDVSYFKPSKYVGVWWEMHLAKSGWDSKPVHGARTENVKRYIDFAAKYGFPGVLVEGWNKGWDTAWFGDGKGFDFDVPTPDFDARFLADYAKKKHVALIGHNETGGSMSHYESQFERAMQFASAHGESVVKTGYVADAGQIERVGPNGEPMREWHDGQFSSNHHLRVLTMAHKYKVAIDAHEPIKDTGLRRTYPNWISREGARGQEYNAWGLPKNAPEHEANLVFTRMLAGPMDYTPGVLSLTGQGGTPILTTEAKQLALYVVLYSPVQMAADLPENYEKHLAGFQFIRDVAVDWADTRVLNGEVGDYVTIARKDRNGPDWFLGSVTDENARTLNVPLDFLEAGKSYEAQIYRDGDDADYRTEKRHSITVEKRRVTAGDTLAIKLAPGGGQAIRFRLVK